MTTVTVEEIATLPKLIDRLLPGEELVIVSEGRPLAHVKKADAKAQAGKAGCYRKEGFWMAPDFNEPLEDFAEYMS